MECSVIVKLTYIHCYWSQHYSEVDTSLVCRHSQCLTPWATTCTIHQKSGTSLRRSPITLWNWLPRSSSLCQDPSAWLAGLSRSSFRWVFVRHGIGTCVWSPAVLTTNFTWIFFWFPSKRKICKRRGREVRLICIFSWNGHSPPLHLAVFCCLNYKFHLKKNHFLPKGKYPSEQKERSNLYILLEWPLATSPFGRPSVALTTNFIAKKIISTQKENIQAKEKGRYN